VTSVQRDYYKVLQIDPEADPEVVDAAYKVHAARFHPERDLTGVHEVRLAELNRVHAVLSDPGRRRTYDIEREDRFGPIPPREDVAHRALPSRPRCLRRAALSPE
jgi:curved DNA-binding protein CbpA